MISLANEVARADVPGSARGAFAKVRGRNPDLAKRVLEDTDSRFFKATTLSLFYGAA